MILIVLCQGIIIKSRRDTHTYITSRRDTHTQSSHRDSHHATHITPS
jgi:hypothetical protein